MSSASERSEQKLMFIVGAVLLASGLFHLLAWAVLGGSMSGDVSWRKPILFGFSTGATMVSLGWVLGKIKQRRGDFVLFSLFSMLQCFTGRARFELWWLSAVVLIVAIGFFAQLLALFATHVTARLAIRIGRSA